jgi:hypothetical protein
MFLICCTNRNDKKLLAHQAQRREVLDFIEHVIIAFLSNRALVYGIKGWGQACALNEKEFVS